MSTKISYTIDSNGCWLWDGPINDAGYGIYWDGVRFFRAHRIVYESIKGAIDSKLVLDHLCRVRRCVNPAHLEPVNKRLNTLRGIGLPAINAKKTHCKHGHEFTKENALFSNGRRQCRLCIKRRNAARNKTKITK